MVQALSEDLVLVVKLTVTEAPHQNIHLNIQDSNAHKKRTRRSFEKIVCNLFKPEEVK